MNRLTPVLALGRRLTYHFIAVLVLVSVSAPIIARAQEARIECGNSAANNKLDIESQNQICNNTEQYDTFSQCSSGSSGGGLLTSDDNAGAAFKFLRDHGLGPIQAAAVVGNLKGESGVNPTAQEDRSKDIFPKNVYPKLIANRSEGRPIGFGIVQWTWSGRQLPLVEIAQSRFGNLPANDPKLNLTNLGLQLDYLWMELNGTAPAHFQPGLKEINATQDIDKATQVFMEVFERPASNLHPERQAFAREALKKYGGITPNPAGSAPAAGATCSNNGVGGTVTCEGGAPGASTGLSPTRQSVVCLAHAELNLWNSGQLKPGTGYFKYSQNAQQDWCANFVSWLYWQAKYPISPEPNWRVPAVQGIWDIGKQNKNFHFHAKGSYTPRPGDMVIYKENASHVNLVVAVAGTTMSTIGGNQNGSHYSNSKVSFSKTVSINGGEVTGFVSPD